MSNYFILLHGLIGLIALLMVIRSSRIDAESSEHLKSNLGQIILISVLAWPYLLFNLIFSFEFWHKPIRFWLAK